MLAPEINADVIAADLFAATERERRQNENASWLAI
jgi:hypothetical protein